MKIRNNESGQWDCFESKIDNSKQMKNILEKIGCKTIFTFWKTRQTFSNNFIRIDLDEIKNLGVFLKVKFLADLKIDLNKHDKRSIIEIHLSKQNK